MPMSTTRRNAALAVAGLVVLLALALRWESARHHITGLASHCTISKKIDCDKVQASAFASVLGVPLAVWAAAGHLILISWILAGKLRLAGLFAAANLLFALYLAYVSFFRIGALCLYCIAMQLCILVLAVLIVPPALRAKAREGGLAFAGMVAALFAALAFMGEAYVAQRSELQRLFQPGETVKHRVDVSDSPVIGDPTTPCSGLLFLDFGCPFCRNCYLEASRIVRTYPEKIHFIVKHYPLDECNDYEKNKITHPGACIAAYTATAATRKGGGAFALAYLFDQSSFYPQVIEDLGPKIGVEMEEWMRLLQDKGLEAVVDRDMIDGHTLQIRGVPKAYIEGRPVDADRMMRVVANLDCSGTR